MQEEDNRWARPTMDDCKWTTADGLPAWMCEEGIQRGLSMQAENPVLVLVGSDPMLHRVDEGDGNPPMYFWRACVYMLTLSEIGVDGTRFASTCMREESDTANSIRDDYVEKVVNFIAKCSPSTRIRHVN